MPTKRNPTCGCAGPQIVMFSIVGADFCGACSATARVISRPPGVSRVQGEGPSGQITVYDKTYPNSCFLNEPPEQLLNRVGFAAYLNAAEDGPCPDTVGNLWHILSLCCGDTEPC